MPTLPRAFTDPANINPIKAAADAATDYRALVCVFLFGGNDSHNMVIPRPGSSNRAVYDSQRDTLAVTAGTELALNSDWGLNPAMDKMKALYDSGKLAVLMNVGVLKQPTDRAKYLARSVKLPAELFSHNSQTIQWQTVPPFMQMATTGWVGRAVDLAGDIYNPLSVDDIDAGFSITGRPLQLQGYVSGSNDMQSTGATVATAGTVYGSTMSSGGFLNAARRRAETGNIIQNLVAQRVSAAINRQAVLAGNLQTLASAADARYSALTTNSLAQQLKAVARIIQSRGVYAQRRQIFFVGLGGWDDHDNLLTAYGPRLDALDEALNAFYLSLGDLGVQENVVTFTESEFGRALKRNGNGSDHGWGGHALIMGGSVLGGAIYGTPPNLNLNSSNDAGQGRLIPTTSVDQYAATMLKWWGIPEAQLPVILENLGRFTPNVLPMLREPVAASGVPTKRWNFIGSMPEGWTHSRTGPCMQVNRNGQYEFAPMNAIVDSDRLPATTGCTRTDNYAMTPDGYMAASLYVANVGQTTSDGGSNGGASTFVETFGLRAYVTFLVKPVNSDFVKLRESSTTGAYYLVNCKEKTGAWISSSDPSSEIVIEEAELGYTRITVFRRHNSAMNITIKPSVAIGDGVTGFILCNAQADVHPTRRPYIRTTGNAYHAPRLQDYDPVKKTLKGAYFSGSSRNEVPSSTFQGAVAGIPGTYPMGMSFPAPAGMVTQILRTGDEDGIPFIDVRLVGTPVSTGNAVLSFNASTGAPALTGETWTGSVFAALKAGSFAGFSSYGIRVIANLASAFVSNSARSGFENLKDVSIGKQRVSNHFTITGTVDAAQFQVAFGITAGVFVDVTLRLGGPQLEKKFIPYEWIPTRNAAANKQGDVVLHQLSGASWFNPLQGTVVAKLVHASPLTAALHYPVFFSASVNGASGDSMTMQFTSTTGRSVFTIQNGAVFEVNASADLTIPPGTKFTHAIGFQQNNFNTATNGKLGTADTTGNIPAVTQFSAGNASAVSQPFWIESLDYYNTRRPDTDLVVLSAG